MTHRLLILAACLVLHGIVCQPTFAQQETGDAKTRLREVEKNLAAREAEKKALEKAAQKAEAEAMALSRDLVTAAADIRQTEENTTRIEQRISDLETTSGEKKASLVSRRQEMAGLLAALERLSRRPAAFTFLQPSEALDTARSAALMGTIIPEINKQATQLRADLAGLAEIQQKLSTERYALKNSLQQLTVRQEKLASLLERRKAEAAEASAGARVAASDMSKFANEAKTLKELIDKLERQAAKERAEAEARAKREAIKEVPVTVVPPSGQPITKAKGALPYPAVGAIVQRFGDKEAMGQARGIRIKARKGGQIVAPYDGQIVFAGPFRDYGQLLIIAHAGGYHTLLAGFAEMDGSVGQWVLTGEPLGTMTKSGADPELYMELRRNGSAVDPLPWLSKKTAAAE